MIILDFCISRLGSACPVRIRSHSEYEIVYFGAIAPRVVSISLIHNEEGFTILVM